ncbi:TLD-domain-containing protein [Filobasidium floriforme]|uniref:TLD-domain-containing protein n=1 Tax=Filobasidium floriforme TaxID=5210 RepID=UPI001E8E8E22|nr:TLD-domain-containing protein [Filobasidium floriforme]KAH8081161.1 TLD-domain-containing protein [Filobasidium floriforme]
MDRPTPTAQPIEITHHTPFNLNSSANQHSVYIPGTNTIIQPTGSYMPAPPSGAPGFRNEQVGVWQGDKSQRRDDWGGTKLVGRREGTFQVLDDHAADALRPNLPARQRLSNTWTLLFSLDQHGGSLSTFYRLIEAYSKKHPHAGNLLIVKDENDRRFGVYMNEWIKRVEGTYTGSGESWLYKIAGNDLDARAKVFKWTGRNTYFALCESDFISFGGGDGKYGLWVDKVFQNGSSATSPAYANEVLCAQEGSTLEKARFDCMGLEVWATSG